jgi:fucose 4-O-acetylase-like acetyltransferase
MIMTESMIYCFVMALFVVVSGSIFVILQDRKESRELEEEASE